MFLLINQQNYSDPGFLETQIFIEYPGHSRPNGIGTGHAQ